MSRFLKDETLFAAWQLREGAHQPCSKKARTTKKSRHDNKRRVPVVPAPADPCPNRTAFRNARKALGNKRYGGQRIPQPPPAKGDNFLRIRGIGFLVERNLKALGITRYIHIARWTPADVARLSNVLDFNGRIEREDWIGQAQILALGGKTEFSERVDADSARLRLVIGRLLGTTNEP